MALASSPAAVSSSTHRHTPRISASSSCFCPPSGARAPCLLRAATTASSAASASSRSRGGGGHLPPPAALPDPQAAAALLLAAAVTVGAASLLLRSSSSGAASQQRQEERDEQVEGEECPDCGGTGLCGRCKGEGFVFKQLSEETATRARKAAKNMATRYTSGLPTKWTYCNKCSSTRSCTTCRGSGRIVTTPPPVT